MAESPFPEELFVPMAEIITMYPNSASTASRHPGTASSACAVSPSLNVTGFSGPLVL